MSDEAARPDGPALPRCPHCGGDHAAHLLKCSNTDMPLPLEGRILHEKFRFLRQLGKGGMASVWAATNTLVDRSVAIKLIRPEAGRSEDTVARFRAEAKAAGRIGHPNVCEILDFGIGPIGPYIVMERLRGKNLGALINDEERLDPALTVGILRQALAGLEAAHRRGIIHRDLKPENLFVHQPEAGPPVVKIMDFGVSKLTDGSAEVQTEHGALLGTPEYMSPEQFKGAAGADARTDIWAVGAILYKALTGENAFGGPTVAATLLMVTTDPHTPIPEQVRGVPPELVTIVDRCLSKDPDERFQTAQELADELEAFDLGTLDALEVVEPDAAEDEPAGPTIAVTSTPSHPSLEPPPDPSTDEPETIMPTTKARVAERPRRPARPERRAWLLIIGVTVIGAGVLVALSRAPKDDEPRDAAGPANPVAAASGASSSPEDTDDADEPTATTGETTEATTGSGTTDESTTGPGGRTSTGDEAPGSGGTEADPDTASTGSTTGATEPAGTDPTPASDPPSTGRTESSTPSSPTPNVARPSTPPPGTILVGNYLTLQRPGPKGTHAESRTYCRNLGKQGFVGVREWKLASPAVAKKVASRVKKGKYWTSALWQGKARVIAAPSKETESRPAEKSGPRALCVARWE